MADEPHLEIDSHVVIQLGAELISDSEQALLELVKNAYDGDATRCTIVIDPDWQPDEGSESWEHFRERVAQGQRIGRIIVEDNGTGLDENAVSRGWLLISASLKRSSTGTKLRTDRKRIPVGDKGLGRLATMRLGDVLFLRTKVSRESRPRFVSFAWSDFKPGATLKDIKVNTGVSPSLRSRDHGTDVEIQGLLEPPYWESEPNIQGVVAKLSSLISPFKRMQDFQVHVRARDSLRDLQSLSSEALNHAAAKFVFEYANGKLHGKAWFARTLFRGASGGAAKKVYEELMSESGLPLVMAFFQENRKVQSMNFTPLLEAPGGWLFSLEDTIALADMPADPKIPGPKDPGPFSAELSYVLFNEPTRQALDAAGLSLDLLREMTSIGVFRDGFRIRMSDDWLELSKGVTSGGFFQLRPKNVVGYFAVSNEHNAGLIEKSDREGFVDNEYSRGFMFLAGRARQFANHTLEMVRTAYNEYKDHRYRDNAGGSEESDAEQAPSKLLEQGAAARAAIKVARERGVVVTRKIDALRESLQHLAAPAAESVGSHVSADLVAIQESLLGFQDVLKEAEDSADASLRAAKGLVLSNDELGERNMRLIDAAAVGLSARGLTHEINSYVSMIDTALAKVRRAHKAKPDKRLEEAVDAIAGAIRELRKSVSTINPLLGGSRSLKDNFHVREAIAEFLGMRASRLAEERVEFRLRGGQGPRIRFGRTRFNQILENLFQNSLYWINEHQTNDGTVQRTIDVEVDKSGFTWWDGAKGVRQALEETLFEPYVTDKPENRGQGLGLFLTTAFLQSEKSDITLLSDRNASGRRYKFRVNLIGAIQ